MSPPNPLRSLGHVTLVLGPFFQEVNRGNQISKILSRLLGPHCDFKLHCGVANININPKSITYVTVSIHESGLMPNTSPPVSAPRISESSPLYAPYSVCVLSSLPSLLIASPVTASGSQFCLQSPEKCLLNGQCPLNGFHPPSPNLVVFAVCLLS